MTSRLAAYLSDRSRRVERELERLISRRGPAAIPFLAPMPTGTGWPRGLGGR